VEVTCSMGGSKGEEKVRGTVGQRECQEKRETSIINQSMEEKSLHSRGEEGGGRGTTDERPHGGERQRRGDKKEKRKILTLKKRISAPPTSFSNGEEGKGSAVRRPPRRERGENEKRGKSRARKKENTRARKKRSRLEKEGHRDGIRGVEIPKFSRGKKLVRREI